MRTTQSLKISMTKKYTVLTPSYHKQNLKEQLIVRNNHIETDFVHYLLSTQKVIVKLIKADSTLDRKVIESSIQSCNNHMLIRI
jgi:hypothetical protein